MLSQFTPEQEGQITLKDVHDFPTDVYPVGRLDKDSEGLLVLTNDNLLKTNLLNPVNYHPRTYWAQVEGSPDPLAIKKLTTGVRIRIQKKYYQTRPAQARILDSQAVEMLPERNPPIRFRKSVPDHWIELVLTEGKNRQVRRMCAQVGFPVLRLVRIGIGGVRLSHLEGKPVHEVAREWLLQQLTKSKFSNE